MAKISVVIRTLNEEKWIKKMLESLKKQSLQDFEVVIVDNESTDSTITLIKKYFPKAVVTTIPRKEFSHPYSENIGVQTSSANLVVLTNGHCELISKTWLEEGTKMFDDPKVAGVGGHYFHGSGGYSWQPIGNLFIKMFTNKREISSPLTSTNCIIRKDLWQEYKFDESLFDCEDWDWSREMVARGYKTIKDPNLSVNHYHPISLLGSILRALKWGKTIAVLEAKIRPTIVAVSLLVFNFVRK